MAAVDYFLKIEGIDGESNLKGYIQVLGWSWGVANVNPGGVVNAPGKVTVQDLSFVHHVDVASPQMLQASCAGQGFKQAMLVGQGTQQGQTVTTLLLSDVFITGVQAQADGGDPIPVEQVSLNFSKIEWTVTGADGTSVVGFCDGSVRPSAAGS